MTRQNPRRPVSSRTPTSRPRRIAGRGSTVEPADTAAADTETETPLVEPVETTAADAETEEGEPTAPSRDLGGLFGSPRTTRVLLAVTVVLAVVAAALGGYVWQHDEDPASATPPPEGVIAVPEDRPVLLSADDAQRAVAAAAEAATTIVATSYQDYDEQVDEAVALMTDEFAKEYRTTAEDVRKQILDTKTEVEVRIVAQGVVRANTSEVQALLFLNQYTSKDGGKTTYTPYRTLVTVVHTERGWLVSDLDTQ